MEAVNDEKLWYKSSTLLGTDKIDMLIKALCDKKQEDEVTYTKTLDLFVRGHGVKLVRDLF